MDARQSEVIEAIVRNLRRTKNILFITGAGLSADSGLPTYRGIGGLYDVDLTEEGMPIEEVLSGPMLESNPALTWKYLVQLSEAIRGHRFNRGHEVISEMERHFPRVWTLTQNVDGFHRQAGARNVIEIHGNMRSLSCTQCEHQMVITDSTELDIPPRCPECSAALRPDAVLFDETLPSEAVSRLRRELETGFGAIFSVGTSSVFPYIQQPIAMARQWGAFTVEINPVPTVLSDMVDYRLATGAAAALDEIWKRFSSATAAYPPSR